MNFSAVTSVFSMWVTVRRETVGRQTVREKMVEGGTVIGGRSEKR